LCVGVRRPGCVRVLCALCERVVVLDDTELGLSSQGAAREARAVQGQQQSDEHGDRGVEGDVVRLERDVAGADDGGVHREHLAEKVASAQLFQHKLQKVELNKRAENIQNPRARASYIAGVERRIDFEDTEFVRSINNQRALCEQADVAFTRSDGLCLVLLQSFICSECSLYLHLLTLDEQVHLISGTRRARGWWSRLRSKRTRESWRRK
jgi:hypothetical protein